MFPFQGHQEELSEATRTNASGILGKQTWFVQNRILLGFCTLLLNGFWKSRVEKRVKLLANREVTGLLKKKAEIRDIKISDKKQRFSRGSH